MKENNSEEEPIYLEAPINIMTKLFSILTIMNFSKLENVINGYLMYNPQIDETIYIQDNNENKFIVFSKDFYIYDKQNNKTIERCVHCTISYEQLYNLMDKRLVDMIEAIIIDMKKRIIEYKKNFLKQ